MHKKAFCFIATEVFLRVQPGKNPNFLIVTLGGELLSKTAKDVMINTERVYVYNNTRNEQALKHFQKGDLVTLAGKVIKQSGVEKLVAFEVFTVNTYLDLDIGIPEVAQTYDLKQTLDSDEAIDDEEVF